jgi:multidrug efflux system membrane fusion protein
MRNTIVLNCLASALAVLLLGCGPSKSASPAPIKVTVSLPQRAIVTNWDEYSGHIEAVDTVGIRPRVAGYIDSVHFQDGASVKSGDLLFVIDPRPYQAELAHARAQREQAESRLELARNDFKRAEGLRGTKAISEEDYDSRSKAVQEAEAVAAAARAAEATAQINLDYTQIKAPISGQIGRRLVTPGNFVQLQGNGGAATLLATIVSTDPMYCYFDVEEGAFLRYGGNAKAGLGGQGADGGIACELGLVNEDGFGRRGRIDFADNQVNPQTGTIRLRAVFDNADGVLLPGMFARVRVAAGLPEETLLVPEVAIGSEQGYKYVYVVNAENKVETRPIQEGRTHGTQRAILKGLKPDDKVVVNGLVLLHAGVKVQAQIAEPKAAGTGPATGEGGTAGKP